MCIRIRIYLRKPGLLRTLSTRLALSPVSRPSSQVWYEYVKMQLTKIAKHDTTLKSGVFLAGLRPVA